MIGINSIASIENKDVLNILPCSISYQGTSNNDKFFKVYKNESSEFYESSLRGRRLEGDAKVLPAPLKGIILNKNLTEEGGFDCFLEWHSDKYDSAKSTETSIDLAIAYNSLFI